MTIRAMAAILTLVLTAGCTDLKPMQAQIEDLQTQINKLQTELAKSTNTAAVANKTTAASAATASEGAKQALSIGESNTTAIDKLNTKIDQMFKKAADGIVLCDSPQATKGADGEVSDFAPLILKPLATPRAGKREWHDLKASFAARRPIDSQARATARGVRV